MRALLGLVTAVFCLSLTAGAARAQTPSAWDEIMANKKLVACVIPAYQPYSYKDPSGQWKGFSVDMVSDIAKALHIDIAYRESNLKTLVLDLQADKCQVFIAFNATPERALAIDFAGPIYTLGFLFVGRKGWHPPGNKWTDFNSPDIRVCYTVGNSSEQQLKRLAPKSTQIQLQESTDCILALISNRADAYLDGVMGALGAKQKSADLGDVIVPTPSFALPSYAGLRIDSDGRLDKFIQRWAEYNRANGNITEWLMKNMEAVGISRAIIPPDIQF